MSDRVPLKQQVEPLPYGVLFGSVHKLNGVEIGFDEWILCPLEAGQQYIQIIEYLFFTEIFGQCLVTAKLDQLCDFFPDHIDSRVPPDQYTDNVHEQLLPDIMAFPVGVFMKNHISHFLIGVRIVRKIDGWMKISGKHRN